MPEIGIPISIPIWVASSRARKHLGEYGVPARISRTRTGNAA